MSKNKRRTKKIQRQLDLLSKYYDVDSENKLVTIGLHYEKGSELFENDVITKGVPKFKTEILARVSELLETIPDDFKVDFSIKVDDYEGYKVDNVVESFKDQLEVFNFQIYRVKSVRWLKAVILTLVCVAILLVRRFLLDREIIDDKILLTEMLDITAWVFLWTGVSTIFLESSEYRSVSFRIIDTLNSFSLLDSKGNILSKMNHDQIVKDWVHVSRREKNARRLLLIAGALALSIGTITIINSLPEFFRSHDDLGKFLLSALAQDGSGIIGIIGGIGAISLYCEYGKMQKAVPLVSYIYLVSDIAIVAIVSYTIATSDYTPKENAALIIGTVISLGASILYFISYMLLRKAGRENGEEEVYKF